MSAEVARREPTPLEIIDRITSNPNFGPAQMEVIERMFALKERIDAQSKKDQYAAAMAELQSELPQMDAHGKILNKDGTAVRSKYARIEDIDVQIRPYLAKYGFSFSYDTRPADKPSEIRILGTVTHTAGHSETKQIDMPIETGAMSDQQKRGSTLSHGIRAILKMFLNLVSRGMDDDAQGNPELITAKDLARVKELIDQKGADEDKFKDYMKVKNYEDIQRRDVPRAMALLRAKADKKVAE